MNAPINHEERVEFLKRINTLASEKEKIDSLLVYLEKQNEILDFHQQLILKLVSTTEHSAENIKGLSQTIADVVDVLGKKSIIK